MGTEEEYRVSRQIKAPERYVTEWPNSIAVDRTGVHWLTWERQLYKAIDGMCVAAFAANEQQPFVDGRTVEQALTDGKSNTFLLTHAFQRDEYVVMKPGSAVPDTEMTVTREGPDAFRMNLSATVPGEIWYRWRLNGGEWSRPNRETEMTFGPISAGDHVVEAVAVTPQLLIDATPATASFKVQITAEDIAEWVAALTSPDYDKRESAVKSLAKNPDRALPALKKAGDTADGDLRWWIDTAIELIETKAHREEH